MARRRITTRAFRMERRKSIWAGINAAENSLAAPSTAIISHFSSAALLALRPFTIVRTRLVFHVRPDQVAATEDYGVAIAAAVVSDQAAGVGVTAVPTPDTDRASDLFFLFEEAYGLFFFGTAVGVDFVGGQRVVIDSKAMRKVTDGDDVVFVQETQSVVASATTFLAGRMLVKLH